MSDQGPQFIDDFTHKLYQLLRIKLLATTACYLKGDSQTKQVNQELEQYLQLFINNHQENWDNLLLLAEFQYNSHVHLATQQTHFMLDMGLTLKWPLSLGRLNLEQRRSTSSNTE